MFSIRVGSAFVSGCEGASAGEGRARGGGSTASDVFFFTGSSGSPSLGADDPQPILRADCVLPGSRQSCFILRLTSPDIFPEPHNWWKFLLRAARQHDEVALKHDGRRPQCQFERARRCAERARSGFSDASGVRADDKASFLSRDEASWRVRARHRHALLCSSRPLPESARTPRICGSRVSPPARPGSPPPRAPARRSRPPDSHPATNDLARVAPPRAPPPPRPRAAVPRRPSRLPPVPIASQQPRTRPTTLTSGARRWSDPA